MSVENLLAPDRSPLHKIIYRYDADGKVVKEIYVGTKREGLLCYVWGYGYDAEGRLSTITTMNGRQDTIGIVTAIYDTDGKVQKKIFDDRRTSEACVVELDDTTKLKRESLNYMKSWRKAKRPMQKIVERMNMAIGRKERVLHWTVILPTSPSAVLFMKEWKAIGRDWRFRIK